MQELSAGTSTNVPHWPEVIVHEGNAAIEREPHLISTRDAYSTGNSGAGSEGLDRGTNILCIQTPV